MSDALLSGARILIVEDEAVIAFDLQSILCEAGAVIVGPAATLAAARPLAERSEISAAILDVQIGGAKAFSIATSLAERGIPFVFHTGHADGDGVNLTWPDVEILMKPATRAMIVSPLARLVHKV
jgi:DNA-binding NtrC family response regulator